MQGTFSGPGEKLSDGLIRLREPVEGTVCDLEIVFFHGLSMTKDYRDAYHLSWTSRTEKNEDVLWPATWLAEEFPRARIYAVSYDSCVSQTSTTGRQDLYSIAESLLGDMLKIANLGSRPMVLVGHCVGGLVIKQLILHALNTSNTNQDTENPSEAFLANVKGFFYFSTPHIGTKLFDSFTPRDGFIVKSVQFLDAENGRLNEEFRKWRGRRIETKGVIEKNETQISKRQSVLVVAEASGRIDTDFCTVLDGDHSSIAKPSSKTASSFQQLVSFIKKVTRAEPAS